MNYYIGADLGTSSLKLLLVDESGAIKKEVSRNYPVYYPAAGWSEQNPEDWWNAFKEGVKELITGFGKNDIKGVCVSGQMHGLVVLDENDKVIRPAVLWNDGRTEKQTRWLNSEIGKEKLSRLTANIAFAGFTAPKILWLKENEPENFKKIKKIMLPKDYINYKLTGVHCTDFSDASGMLLLDVKNKRWSKEMLDICEIKEEQLPKLFESYETVGNVSPQKASAIGLNQIPVCAGAGDNAGAAIGTRTTENGRCNISIGTSGTVFVSANSFSVDENNALHSFCHSNGKYHLMGCILSAASCNKWFCEDILKTSDYKGEQQHIDDAMLGENHVYFLPYLMGERSPINDIHARGTFMGMRMDTSRRDLVLSVLEGVAFAIRDNFEIIKKQGVEISAVTLCGGGAKSKLWQKIFANVLGVPLLISETEQGPAMGSAMLAMVATGRFETVEKCAEQLVKFKDTIMPDEKITARYEKQYAKFKEIYPSVKELFKKIN